ncbi:MAG: M3 family metallopeptidase, partial [Gammaproteobacteria bacterium]|nr:M3 family metallopeptidase [Gammaproteobacteria bacterium]
MPNPLLQMNALPPFADIRPEHVELAIDTVLAENRTQIAALLDREDATYCWDNLVAPVEALEDRLNRCWSPVSHLNAVLNSDELRQAYNACLPKLSAYATEIGQNEALFHAYKAIAEGPEYARLDGAQKKVIDNALRDFQLSGIGLSDDKKARFKEVQQELSRLTSKFGENLLDATQAWKKHLTGSESLSGLPESSLTMLRQNAEREEQKGYLLNLEFPCYFAVMTYADDAELRAELYEAYTTRASDRGPHAGQWDNSQNMEDILSYRHEQAQLLGFAHYAERSLATKMAQSTVQVQSFLRDLAARSLTLAKKELDELQVFARDEYGVEHLQAWDISYYSEKLRQSSYAISQQDLRPYFQADRVINGMFEVVKRLYGLQINEVQGVQVWHEDVRFFEILDNQDQLRGRFYLDLYARSNKRGGAWMDDCICSRQTEDEIQLPVAYLNCNF